MRRQHIYSGEGIRTICGHEMTRQEIQKSQSTPYEYVNCKSCLLKLERLKNP